MSSNGIPISRTILAAAAATAAYALVFLTGAAAMVADRFLPGDAAWWVGMAGSLAAFPLALVWFRWGRRQPEILRAAVFTACYVLVWRAGVSVTDLMQWDLLRTYAARGGVAGFFMLGLAWVVWGVERASQYYAARRRETAPPQNEADVALGTRGADAPRSPDARIWNPLDLDAWYYGRGSKKLSQSLTALGSYSTVFVLLFLFISQLQGCKEIYEMPAGGGEQQTIAQTVKVQKVIKKKFVINPFSAILFNPPPIDEIKLQLLEITSHAYTVGYGQGAGAGFSGGTNRGKVRFIRLEYAGGDWNQDFGVGADLNMLQEYGIRTSHAVNNQTESRTVAQLGNFVAGKSPPVVYLTGQRNISLSKSEIKILREYLLDQHGMLFGDNGGSPHFHNQFVSMMHQVLPNVEPVVVPLDDIIHRVPFQIPFLPYVAPHGGRDALGWKVDGRWVCYYHPGDIGDAWTDDHSGVDPEIWEACYQLGTNVIFYAHVEYNKWLDARKQK